MKHHLTLSITAALGWALLGGELLAAPPGQGQGQGKPGQGRRQQGQQGQGKGQRPGGQQQGQRGQMPPNPILQAIDLNRDGQLTANEIQQAAASLMKLDRNRDGKLTQDELRPQFGGRGQAQGGQRPGQGNQQGKAGGARRGQGQAQGRAGGNAVAGMVERVMQNDKNGDGKVTRQEAPRLAQMFDKLDLNKDGAIEKSEVEAAAKKRAGGGGRVGGGGKQGGVGGGQKPRRPQ